MAVLVVDTCNVMSAFGMVCDVRSVSFHLSQPTDGSHLNEVIEHEGSDTRRLPLGMDRDISNVTLWGHEGTSQHHLLIEGDDGEIWIFQKLGY